MLICLLKSKFILGLTAETLAYCWAIWEGTTDLSAQLSRKRLFCKLWKYFQVLTCTATQSKKTLKIYWWVFALINQKAVYITSNFLYTKPSFDAIGLCGSNAETSLLSSHQRLVLIIRFDATNKAVRSLWVQWSILKVSAPAGE